MVYVKDELIKFEADRIQTSDILVKTKKNLDILEKTTAQRFTNLVTEMTYEKQELTLTLEDRFAPIEKELEWFTAESNITKNKQA